MADSDSDELLDALEAASRAARLSEEAAKLRPADDIPLFMQQLAPKAVSKNETIQALAALKYDDLTREEIAEVLKREGNEYYQKGTPADLVKAHELYTEGLAQRGIDGQVNSVLYANRAAVLLKQRNYPGALADVEAAVVADPNNFKAYYRGASAAFSLGRNARAHELAVAGIARMQRAGGDVALSPACAELTALRDKIARFIADADAREAARVASLDAVAHALAERGVVMGEPILGGQVEAQNSKIHFPPSAPRVLTFPVVLLYPEYGQMDFVDAFAENARFEDQLGTMFPPATPPLPWDVRGEYTARALAVYAVTALSTPVDPRVAEWHRGEFGVGKRAVRIPLGATLLEALSTPGYVLPGVAVFHVVVAKSKFARTFSSAPML